MVKNKIKHLTSARAHPKRKSKSPQPIHHRPLPLAGSKGISKIIGAGTAFAISCRESGHPNIRGALPTRKRIARAPLSLLARLMFASICALPSRRAESWRHAVVAGALWYGPRRRPGRLRNFRTLRSRSPESHALLLHCASPGARLGQGSLNSQTKSALSNNEDSEFPGDRLTRRRDAQARSLRCSPSSNLFCEHI